MLAPPDIPSLRACLAGLGLNSCSSLTVTPVFELRRVAVRMHRSTIINQLKSCEARLNAVIFIGGCLRKRNSAKQALTRGLPSRLCHGRPCAGYPRLCRIWHRKTWMAGAKPGHDAEAKGTAILTPMPAFARHLSRQVRIERARTSRALTKGQQAALF